MMLGMMLTLAEEDKTESERFSCGDWEYVLLEDGTAEIVDWAGAVLTIPDTFARPEVHAEEKTLVIPGTLDDHLVTAIAASALWWDDTATSVALPDSIVLLESNPFERLIALRTITVAAENPVFESVDGLLIRSEDKCLICCPPFCPDRKDPVPEGIRRIGESAVSGFERRGRLTIPASVEVIEDYAFFSCPFTSVTVPEGVIWIGKGAFAENYELTDVCLPASVAYIGEDAFWRDNGFGNLPNLTLTVPRDSYAEEYAKANDIPYTYPDANDWLNGD